MQLKSEHWLTGGAGGVSVQARLGAAAVIARASTSPTATRRPIFMPAMVVDVLIVVVLHISIPRHPVVWMGRKVIAL